MNIGEIKELADGSYVSGPIHARISSTKEIDTKTGKKMFLGKLGDDNDTVDIQSFDQNFTGWDGQEVTLTGKGMKKDSYNGYAKLGLGKSVRIEAADGSAPATKAAPAPSRATPAPSGNHPATVGLAAKILVDLERIRVEAIAAYNATDPGDGMVTPDSERLSSNSPHWDRDLAIWVRRLQAAEKADFSE